ncbi:hypothetical protein [Enterobacter kobei]|uniref:hypothetical protein n=1 Tax=Enterobacter kobei TaxID=208224 RepID=UPI00388D7B24
MEHNAETVQLYHFTFMTLEQTAEEAGYVTYYSRGTGELGEETIRVNYEDSNGNTIPVHTDVVGRGKALTYIGDERVPGTGFSSDNEWQSNALKTAFASIDNNLTLAAKRFRVRLKISVATREKYRRTLSFLKNWWPNSSFLASKPNGESSAAPASEEESLEVYRERKRAELFNKPALPKELQEQLKEALSGMLTPSKRGASI